MIVQIQISDRVYTQLLNGNKRIQGTLALVNPTEGNFNEHRREWRPKPGTRYMRLPHGRVTVNEEQVRIPHKNERRPAPKGVLTSSLIWGYVACAYFTGILSIRA